MEAVPHAILRAKERFGIDISIGTLHQWAHQIKSGEARYIQACSGSGCHLYEVRHGDKILPIIWDGAAREGRGHVVTVLDGYKGCEIPRRTKADWRRESARRMRWRWSPQRWCGDGR